MKPAPYVAQPAPYVAQPAPYVAQPAPTFTVSPAPTYAPYGSPQPAAYNPRQPKYSSLPTSYPTAGYPAQPTAYSPNSQPNSLNLQPHSTPFTRFGK